MNPAFCIIVLILCFVIWMCSIRFYKPIGRKASRVGYNMRDVLNECEWEGDELKYNRKKR